MLGIPEIEELDDLRLTFTARVFVKTDQMDNYYQSLVCLFDISGFYFGLIRKFRRRKIEFK
jgi:hypothetical protein